MPLKAYEDFATEPLAFPVGGKLYTVPPIGVQEGIRLEQIIAGKIEMEGEPADVLWKLAMGSAWDEMLADNVPSEACARAGLAAVADFQFGRETAEAAWEAGGDPNLLAAHVAAKAAGINRASRRSSSTASGRKTPSRATTKRTTSPTS